MVPKPKPQTIRNKKYLLWLRTQPCAACGQPPTMYVDVVAAHRTGGGVGIKNDDTSALPLCVDCHGLEHNGVKTFWGKVNKDREGLVKMYRERYLGGI